MFKIFRSRGREDLEFSKEGNCSIYEKLEKIRIFRRRGRVFEQGNYYIGVWKVFRIFRKRRREDLEFSKEGNYCIGV